MFTFLRNVKKAADFFSIHPDGLGFVTERRLKDVEASVNRIPKAIEDRTLTSIINLEYDVYELKQTIKSLQSKLDKEQVPAQLILPPKQVKASKKRRVIKLKAVKEEVKAIKSELTQSIVKRLFDYKDGELYLKIDRGNGIKEGIKVSFLAKAGSSVKKYVFINGSKYSAGRIIYLLCYGYLPELTAYKDGNSLNTKIENLIATTYSGVSGYKGVTYATKTKQWVARIMKEGTKHCLGTFNSPQEAYKAYCKAAKKLHGEFARVS